MTPRKLSKLSVQDGQPRVLTRTAEVLGGPAREIQEVSGVRGGDLGRLTGNLQPFPGVFADRFKHPHPQVASGLVPAYKALLMQGSDAFKSIHAELVRPAHRFNRLKGAAARKHRQPPEQRLLGRCEKLVAPLDRAAQRTLAFRKVTAASEESEPTIETGQKFLRLKQPDSGGSQLQGQREPVESGANFGNGVRVARVEVEAGADRTRALHEQPTESTPRNSSGPRPTPPFGSARGGTGYSCSPAMRSGSLLVTSTLSRRAAASSSPTVAAASIICSKLSNTSRIWRCLT